MKINHKLKILLQYSLVAICLLFIAKYFSTHQDQLKIISTFESGQIISLIIITISIQLLTACKFHLILKNMGLQNCSYFDWLKVFFVANFVNLHLTQGANLYRSITLKKKYDFPYTNSISALTFFSWFEMILVLLFCLFLIGWANPGLMIQGCNVIMLVSFLIIFLMVTPFIFRKALNQLLIKNEKIKWLQDKIEALLHSLAKSTKEYPLLIKIVLLSIMTFCLYVLNLDICFKAIETPVALSTLSLFTVALLLSRIVNIIPGNLGLTELICGYLSESLGGSLGAGILVSVLLRVIAYFISIFWGILFARTLFVKNIIKK